MNLLCKRCSPNKHLYQWEERGFRGGSDKKMRRMWLGREIFVVCLPPFGIEMDHPSFSIQPFNYIMIDLDLRQPVVYFNIWGYAGFLNGFNIKLGKNIFDGAETKIFKVFNLKNIFCKFCDTLNIKRNVLLVQI